MGGIDEMRTSREKAAPELWDTGARSKLGATTTGKSKRRAQSPSFKREGIYKAHIEHCFWSAVKSRQQLFTLCMN